MKKQFLEEFKQRKILQEAHFQHDFGISQLWLHGTPLSLAVIESSLH